ncbi:MAG: polysaccharide biosynthesis protein [Sphingobacteriales bacterium]|nr:polysaccharide biosynthesis protein [Sphingobacteriales bacterium]
MRLLEKNTPRQLVFLIDLAICTLSVLIAYQLRFNFHVPASEVVTYAWVFPFVVSVRAATFLIFRTYRGIIRYTSSRDTIRILGTLGVGSLCMAVSNPLAFWFSGSYTLPFSIIIIDFLITAFLMISGRLLVKEVYLELQNPNSAKTGVVIYGAGEAGLIAKRTLDRDRGTRYKVVAFIDDDIRKSGNKMEGITIRAGNELDAVLADAEARHLIIAVQQLSDERKQQIVEAGLRNQIHVMRVPPVSSWINGELSFRQIRRVSIDDLLGRDTIQLSMDSIRGELQGKTVLVTGAAGSIGSELVRQISRFGPARVVMLDMAESPLYELELELSEQYTETLVEPVIGDVRNRERMRRVFDAFHPDIVFHAAAYKHVPVMELIGTRITADLSREYGVSRFVMISTDKAVNPTNIMGASKRIAELYTQALNSLEGTRFITTRFGNVLGSNGSVIPRFKKQIEEGQVITVTHPEITRYFMTISEACQLVLEAGSTGKGGEIFIFDMGQPVRIDELARKMIRLSGLEVGKDISIRYTGLRPGEKLFEELLADQENTLPTHHDKIMIAKVRTSDLSQISEDIDLLESLFDKQDNLKLVGVMKRIVPEFISNNSVYSTLDETRVNT